MGRREQFSTYPRQSGIYLVFLHKSKLGKGLQTTSSELCFTRLHKFRSPQFDLIAIQVLFTMYAKNGKKTIAERCSLTTETMPYPKSPTLAKSKHRKLDLK